jgi:triacylglycerol lipase
MARHGGDPARIVLSGHSAGAVHVAEYVAHPRFHASPGSTGLRAAILLSGVYDATTFPAGKGHLAYYGDDASRYAERHAWPGLLETKLPLLVAWAELDPPPFARQAKLLNEALCQRGRCPRFVTLARHSHMSTVYAVNTEDTELGDAILAFLEQIP